jgi:hypothetical protein
MKKILFSLTALASLTLTACGGDVCDNSADAYKSVRSKAEECGLSTTGIPSEPTDAEINTCKEQLKNCTSDDKKLLQDALDCMEDVKSCKDKTEAEQNAFGLSIVACYAKAQGISAACNLDLQ